MPIVAHALLRAAFTLCERSWACRVMSKRLSTRHLRVRAPHACFHRSGEHWANIRSLAVIRLSSRTAGSYRRITGSVLKQRAIQVICCLADLSDATLYQILTYSCGGLL